ncbi:carbohydrate ABC transporter permease [Paenibacillus hodogayensis]|uniref:Carbohydrate ABC transporter permease n=1 Tax=Paenibacillus hodogayensis TaxID=279208 RepID=A0ABV5VZT1_9BACL
MLTTVRIRGAVYHLLLALFAIGMLYPVLWMVSSSFRPSADIFTAPGLWPGIVKLDNYANGWYGIRNSNFGSFLWNSTRISLLSVAATIVSCSMAAYAFARIPFALKPLWFALLLLTLMLPVQVTLIPQYTMFHAFGWIDTIWPLITPKLLATDAFFTFLIVQFIRGLPRELDESATIDGCGYFGIYWRIIMPLALPALITTALFTFLWTWDDFFIQTIYLNSRKMFTVPLGLRLFLDSEGQSDWGAMFAMSVVSLIPCIAIFLFSQKYFVEGIATTGLKG